MELHTTEKSLHGWGRTAPSTAEVLSTPDVAKIADAVRAVAVGAPPALAEVLTRAAELLALGSDAETAWRTGSVNPQVVGLTRMLRRSARAGSSPAAGLSDLARTERAQAEDRAVAAGERAGVAVAGPLGLCFLPA